MRIIMVARNSILVGCTVLIWTAQVFGQQERCVDYSPGTTNECEGADIVIGTGFGCTHPEMIKVFVDDFDGNKLDETFWWIAYGDPWVEKDVNTGIPIWPTHKEWNLPENIVVKDGNANLTAKFHYLPNQKVYYPDNNHLITDYYFSGSGMVSKFQFHNKYGTKYRSRIRLESANRSRYAFWTFGGAFNQTYKKSYEIDIFEVYADAPYAWPVKVFNVTHPWCISEHKFMNWQRMNVLGANTYACQNADANGTLTDFNIYEVEYDFYDMSWRRGTSSNSLSTLRTDNHWYDINGQALSCTNFPEGKLFVNRVRRKRVPNKLVNAEGLRFDHYVQHDYHSLGDDDYTGPNGAKSMTIDYVEVYMELPCSGDVVYNNVSELNLNQPLYNAILVHHADLNNVKIPAGYALKIIHSGEINLNPGTTFDPNSYIDIEPNTSSNCGTTPWSQIYVNEAMISEKIEGDLHTAEPLSNILPSGGGILDGSITIYPNPSSEILTIDLNSGANLQEYAVFDMTGKEVLRGKIAPGARYTQVNLLEISKASYTIVVYGSGGVALYKDIFIRN